jgi:hypothetical protein
MIFGSAPAGIQFHLGENVLTIKTQEKYVGTNFRTDIRNMVRIIIK